MYLRGLGLDLDSWLGLDSGLGLELGFFFSINFWLQKSNKIKERLKSCNEEMKKSRTPPTLEHKPKPKPKPKPQAEPLGSQGFPGGGQRSPTLADEERANGCVLTCSHPRLVPGRTTEATEWGSGGPEGAGRGRRGDSGVEVAQIREDPRDFAPRSAGELGEHSDAYWGICNLGP
jgi:hypothetical protein